jgi:AmmeMemoRadiSam system protein A
MFTVQEKELCKKIVSESIGHKLGVFNAIPVCPDLDIFTKSFGMFITLYKKQKLRGCIGFIEPYKDLFNSLVELAQSAAFKDPRFIPVEKSELDEISIEISILSELIKIQSIHDIIIGRDGLYARHPLGSGLLLPQVATQYGMEAEEFLEQTLFKAGLNKSYLKDEKTEIYRFEAVIF